MSLWAWQSVCHTRQGSRSDEHRVNCIYVSMHTVMWRIHSWSQLSSNRQARVSSASAPQTFVTLSNTEIIFNFFDTWGLFKVLKSHNYVAYTLGVAKNEMILSSCSRKQNNINSTVLSLRALKDSLCVRTKWNTFLFLVNSSGRYSPFSAGGDQAHLGWMLQSSWFPIGQIINAHSQEAQTP